MIAMFPECASLLPGYACFRPVATSPVIDTMRTPEIVRRLEVLSVRAAEVVLERLTLGLTRKNA